MIWDHEDCDGLGRDAFLAALKDLDERYNRKRVRGPRPASRSASPSHDPAGAAGRTWLFTVETAAGDTGPPNPAATPR